MKSPRKHHGANAPVLSIHFRNEFKGRSLARGWGRAKAVLENYNSAVRDPVAISGGGTAFADLGLHQSAFCGKHRNSPCADD